VADPLPGAIKAAVRHLGPRQRVQVNLSPQQRRQKIRMGSG
jgi:hypothetical protein